MIFWLLNQLFERIKRPYPRELTDEEVEFVKRHWSEP